MPIASARSIFEQNIQKNKEAGYTKNILGQKAYPSRVVTRRLFAHNKLADDSNKNEPLNGSLRGDQARRISSSTVSSQGSVTTTGSSICSSTAPTIRRKTSRPQPVEPPAPPPPRRAEPSPPALPDKKSNHTPRNTQQQQQQQPHNSEKISKAFPFKDALAKRKHTKKRNSISDLAEHLGKLNMKSLQARGDGGSITKSLGASQQPRSLKESEHSIEAHQKSFKLPDFRQSTYGRKRKSGNRLSRQPNLHDSVTSLGRTSSDTVSPKANTSRGSRHSESPSPSPRSEDETKRFTVKRRNSRRSANISERLSLINPMSPEKSTQTINIRVTADHSPTIRRSPTRRNTGGWIRPSNSSCIFDEEEGVEGSPRRSQPFRAVPFTKTVIRRHGDGGLARRDSLGSSLSSLSTSMRREGMNNSSRSLKSIRRGSMSSKASRSPRRGSNRSNSSHRRGSMGSNSSRRSTTSRRRTSSRHSRHRPSKRSNKPDTQELALQDEIEALQRQIQASHIKLSHVEEGEECDLKRIHETKERKLKRIDAAEKKQAASTPPALRFPSNPSDGQCKEECTVLTAEQLKRENAKIHDQTRKMKLDCVATKSRNRLLQESTAETKDFVAEVKAQEELHKDEHDLLMSLAATYQKSILELTTAVEKKGPAVERVKKARVVWEDRIGILVAFMKKNCGDLALVEELTRFSLGEEQGGHDKGYESAEEVRSSCVRMPYAKQIESDDESPRSVSDLLMPTSSHSLHLFLE